MASYDGGLQRVRRPYPNVNLYGRPRYDGGAVVYGHELLDGEDAEKLRQSDEEAKCHHCRQAELSLSRQGLTMEQLSLKPTFFRLGSCSFTMMGSGSTMIIMSKAMLVPARATRSPSVIPGQAIEALDHSPKALARSGAHSFVGSAAQ